MNNFNRFDEISHTPLRVFNRVVTLFNLHKDSGEKAAEAYMETFDEGERNQMYVISHLIREKGEKETRKMCTQGLEIVDDAV